MLNSERLPKLGRSASGSCWKSSSRSGRQARPSGSPAMRNALGIFGMLAGIIVVAMVSRYAYAGSDSAVDGAMAGFFFAAIAIGGFAGPAVAVHMFRAAVGWGKLWGVVAALVAAVSLSVNLSNSL